LPPWITEADVGFFVAELTRTGFCGELNHYRNINRNWQLLAPLVGARVAVPTLYIAGNRDLVMAFRGMDQLIPNLTQFVPEPRRTVTLAGLRPLDPAGAGDGSHAAINDFLRRL
jgi:hypothetical protein